MRFVIAAMLVVWTGLAAQAEEFSDEAALALADATTEAATQTSNLKLYIEAGSNQFRGLADSDNGQQVALDIMWRSKLTDRLTLSFSDRYDSYSNTYPSGSSEDVNTLRETYLDWHYSNELMLQAGRVNVRTGVALGYNPTDFFRANALRSIHSVDPEYLRSNRQGSFLLNSQYLWQTGALAVYYLPEVEQPATDGTFALDAGATNATQRSLWVLSQQIGESFRPQFCVFNQLGDKPGYGFNVTHLINDKTVLYSELSSEQINSLFEYAVGLPATPHYTTKSATGFTYTTDFKLSVSAEFDYNGAGLDPRQWRTLQQNPAAFRTALLYSQASLNPPARRNWFYQAIWRDFAVPKMVVTGFVRLSPVDKSRQSWLKVSYPFTAGFEASLQAQFNSGEMGSIYGSTGTDRVVQLLARYYF